MGRNQGFPGPYFLSVIVFVEEQGRRPLAAVRKTILLPADHVRSGEIIIGGLEYECTGVIEAVKTLSPAERQQVRTLLATIGDVPSSADEAAQARLRAAGLLLDADPESVPAPTRHPLIQIKGKPLSQTIIEERG
jgi:hypothetical protein